MALPAEMRNVMSRSAAAALRAEGQEAAADGVRAALRLATQATK